MIIVTAREGRIAGGLSHEVLCGESSRHLALSPIAAVDFAERMPVLVGEEADETHGVE